MKFLLFTLLLIPSLAQAGPLVVAVLDSGFNITADEVPLCLPAATDMSPTLHGSNVAGTIAQEAGTTTPYCLLIFRIFKLDYKGRPRVDEGAYFAALEALIRLRPYAVNLSFGGDKAWQGETRLIKKLLNVGTIVVAAAGNEGKDLTRRCRFFPACADKRVVVVGSLSYKSNKGAPVDVILDGRWRTAAGTTQSGTSQAAAMYTGQLIRRYSENR